MTTQASESTANQSHTTRQRLLDAAVDIFAAEGYSDARVSDICKRAGANVAAVNYYFAHKETLYIEAWRYAFEKAFEAHPFEGGVSPDAPPEERFGGLIRSFVRRALDENNAAFLIMHHEIAHPTGLLDKVRDEMLSPLRQRTHALIGELMGDSATEQHIGLCGMSTISQCLHFAIRRRIMRMPGDGNGLDRLGPDELADHIVTFSLAGIREVCND